MVQGQIPFQKMARGPFAALLRVPEEGYRWDEAIRPDILSAGAERNPQSNQLEPRHLPYDIATDPGPWLVEAQPIGETGYVRQYAPLAKVELHRRFAAVTPTENGIIRFAGRYGLLGDGITLSYPPPSHLFIGESLGYWRQQIAQMGVLVALWDLVERRASDDLSTYVRWYRDPVRVTLEFVFGEGTLHRELTRRAWREQASPKTVWDGSGVDVSAAASQTIANEQFGRDDQDLLAHWSFGDPIGPARYFVHQRVNQRMKGHVSPAVLPFRRGDVFFFPDSLLGALYVHFALELSGGARRRAVCARPGCSRYFLRNHGNRLYCSEQCSKLHYYHKHKTGMVSAREGSELG